MEKKSHKYISIVYKMYIMEDGVKVLKDTAEADRPYTFISGMGYTIDALENVLVGLNEGDTFETTISKENAFGEYDENHVVELAKEQFVVNGELQVSPGEVVPLRDGTGQIFNATVQEIKDKVVVLDLNHPFAGADLIFEGKVLVSHEATTEELNEYLNAMTGGGCGCGCGDCGGGCDDGCGDSHCGCGCGHEH